MDAAWAAPSEPGPAKNAFEMSKEHFNLLAFGLGLGIEGRFGSQPGKITGVFMFLAADEAGVCVWAAFWF